MNGTLVWYIDGWVTLASRRACVRGELCLAPAGCVASSSNVCAPACSVFCFLLQYIITLFFLPISLLIALSRSVADCYFSLLIRGLDGSMSEVRCVSGRRRHESPCT
jgi:hypothetical protein